MNKVSTCDYAHYVHHGYQHCLTFVHFKLSPNHENIKLIKTYLAHVIVYKEVYILQGNSYNVHFAPFLSLLMLALGTTTLLHLIHIFTSDIIS